MVLPGEMCVMWSRVGMSRVAQYRLLEYIGHVFGGGMSRVARHRVSKCVDIWCIVGVFGGGGGSGFFGIRIFDFSGVGGKCFLLFKMSVQSGIIRSVMIRKNRNFNFASSLVLGMHDALVSLTGLIAGLTFALSDNYSIVMSAIVASVTAGLSMGASNYLANKTNKIPRAWLLGVYTGCPF